jgi:quercetin dioxygenase-like cupin family protein
MGYRVMHAGDAPWQPSRTMGVMNADVGRGLGHPALGARLWRLAPGQANTRHRQRDEWELYVLLEGTGRIRISDELLRLEPLSAVVIEPQTVRQVFNDTAADALWLITGAPPETGLGPDDAAWIYPDGAKAMPPELS